MASVQTNKIRSEYFRLTRSTRQGCPLSLLLFALAIEPLAVSLRASKEYSGIHRGGKEHKVSLFPNDLLIYISDPSKSVPAIISILNKFGQLSGYKINVSKSILFPIKTIKDQQLFDKLPFRISTQFKYIGINITKTFAGLYKENFQKLLVITTLDLQRWSHIPLTLAGQINIIKMTILPNFLFFYISVFPYISKVFFFHSIDKIISEFIWNRKKPRLRVIFLQRPKPVGGMGLPNFQL